MYFFVSVRRQSHFLKHVRYNRVNATGKIDKTDLRVIDRERKRDRETERKRDRDRAIPVLDLKDTYINEQNEITPPPPVNTHTHTHTRTHTDTRAAAAPVEVALRRLSLLAEFLSKWGRHTSQLVFSGISRLMLASSFQARTSHI